MTWAYYNEIAPYAAARLRNLIATDRIPAGEVDTRDIREVTGDDLKGFTQVHLFAGVGGWSRALRLAGWPGDRPVWTGSCPCQPFSAAGKQKGTDDPRHLWPEMHRLVAECRPATIFGEQVAPRLGREWLAGVRADLEALDYAVGAADLCAASAGEKARGRISYEDNTFEWQRIVIGAPHIRQRLWWVADASYAGRGSEYPSCDLEGRNAIQPRWQESPTQPDQRRRTGGLADSSGPRLEGRQVEPARKERATTERGGGTGFWSDFDTVFCADGKTRRIEPGVFPLAHGVSERVARLRAIGNAIAPPNAMTFITSFMTIN